VRRALHAFLLVFAFLLSQAGLAAHAAGHVADIKLYDHKAPPVSEPCELCEAYAQVSGGAPVPPFSLPVCLATFEQVASSGYFIPARFVVTQRARAPPVHPV
jgi:hypothetical protein